MTDHPEASDEPGEAPEGKPPADEDAPPGRNPVFRAAVPSLASFLAIQRHLASIDFFAVRRAQRAIGQSDAVEKMIAAQDAIAKGFARSVDFSRLNDTYRALTAAGAATKAMTAQQRWAESLTESIDFAALNDAVASIAALDRFARTGEAFDRSLREQADFLARVAQAVTLSPPRIDFPRLLEALDRWLPVNLRGVAALDAVATIALDEGLPLSWVPREEIVVLLVEADDAEARIGILSERRSDILDDCEKALGPIDHEWASQCHSAIAAMRAGLDGPAQSHASNIIDSIVLGLHGKNGRERAKKRAQEEFDDLPLQLAAENLALRPLFRAFTTWYPNTGVNPPDYFARHATSHAVGHAGVFAPTSALVGVMLATSLTLQYAPGEPKGHGTTTHSAPRRQPIVAWP